MNQKTLIRFNNQLLEVRVEERLKCSSTELFTTSYTIKGMAILKSDYNKIVKSGQFEKLVLPKGLEHKWIFLSKEQIEYYDK